MSMCEIKSIAMTRKDINLSVESCLGSTLFLKKLIPLSVMNIIYNRVHYDKKLFNHHKLSGQKYVILTSRCGKKHPLIAVHNWVNDMLDSIERKFLKEFYMIIQDENMKVLEHYRFILKYSQVEKPVVPDIADMLNSSSNFLEAINHLSNQSKKYERNVKFAMQVVLNEESPIGYVTPNFECTSPIISPTDTEGYLSITSLNTGYHKYKILAKGGIFKHHEAIESGTVEENELKDSSAVNKSVLEAEESVNLIKPLIEDDKRRSSNQKLIDIDVNKEISFLEYNEAASEDLNSELQEIVSCVCDISVTFAGIDMVLCTMCNQKQHVACIGHINFASVKQPHICYNCCIKGGARSADVRIRSLKKRFQREMLSRLRLLTQYCVTTNKSPEDIINNIPEEGSKETVDMLFKMSILINDGGRYTANILKMKERIVPFYFYKEIDSQELGSTCAIELEERSEASRPSKIRRLV